MLHPVYYVVLEHSQTLSAHMIDVLVVDHVCVALLRVAVELIAVGVAALGVAVELIALGVAIELMAV